MCTAPSKWWATSFLRAPLIHNFLQVIYQADVHSDCFCGVWVSLRVETSDFPQQPINVQDPAVTAPKVLVGDCVQHAVQTGVGVSHQDSKTVDSCVVRVINISDDDDGVRCPTDSKHHEDDKDGASQPQWVILLPTTTCHNFGFPTALWSHLVLALLHMLVDTAIANEYEDDGEGYTGHWEEQGIWKIGSAVPDTAHGLWVIGVVTPSIETRALH